MTKIVFPSFHKIDKFGPEFKNNYKRKILIIYYKDVYIHAAFHVTIKKTTNYTRDM